MRIKIQGPSGASVITLSDDDNVSSLVVAIEKATSLAKFEVKVGFPAQVLALEEYAQDTKLSELPVKLNGQQLTVNPVAGAQGASENSPSRATSPALPVTANPSSLFRSDAPTNPSPLHLERKQNKSKDDPPEVAVPSRGTIVLRIMPDDNSCLFRAFGTAFMGNDMDNMHEFRSIIAQIIQAQPDKYNKAVLEQSPDEYCKWIQTKDAWGGGIELGILSEWFDLEIASIDVSTLRVDRFNEGKAQRVILVYSGIHYDTIALSPFQPAGSPEEDTKVFSSADDTILEKAVELCAILKQRHYYTDTASFDVKCNTCGAKFKGQLEASTHASLTNHSDFAEA
jgi:ubiquitin thioesterase OTU1